MVQFFSFKGMNHVQGVPRGTDRERTSQEPAQAQSPHLHRLPPCLPLLGALLPSFSSSADDPGLHQALLQLGVQLHSPTVFLQLLLFLRLLHLHLSRFLCNTTGRRPGSSLDDTQRRTRRLKEASWVCWDP